MKKRMIIPNTELSVYPIGLGAANAGLKGNAADTEQIFNTYLELGGNVIDTAHVYSDWVPPERARSERVIGDWLKQSGKRNDIVLITKGGHPDITGPVVDLHKSRMTRADMEQDLNESLEKLRTDHIDIYFYHRDNVEQSIEETIEVMEDFVRQGKIRYYGCSNWSAERMKAADAYCKERGYRGFVADQSLMNLGMKYMNPLEDDTLAYTKDDAYQYHMDTPDNLMMPYMGNCNGFFHMYEKRGEAEVVGNPYCTPQNLEVAKRVMVLKEKYNCSITQVVLGYFYHQPFTCLPLYGTTNVEHIADACKTLEVPFTEEDYKWVLGAKS